MITIKDESVQLKVLSPSLMYILNTLYGMNSEIIPIYPKDWVITSINDGKHMDGSKHYTNEALDLRSKNFKDQGTKEAFVEVLKLRLGKKFTVLLENLNEPDEHFHIQVKKGEKFP